MNHNSQTVKIYGLIQSIINSGNNSKRRPGGVGGWGGGNCFRNAMVHYNTTFLTEKNFQSKHHMLRLIIRKEISKQSS